MFIKAFHLFVTSFVLIQLSFGLVHCQRVYYEDEELEGVHPKADWREVITELAGPLWCNAKLSVKALWCAGTSAYEWLHMGVRQTDRDFCCYMFDTSQCIAGAAKQLCPDPQHYKRITTLLNAKNEQLKTGRCSAYGYQWYDWKSWRCRVPIPLSFGLCATVVTLFLTFLIMKCLSNSYRTFRPEWGFGRQLGRH